MDHYQDATPYQGVFTPHDPLLHLRGATTPTTMGAAMGAAVGPLGEPGPAQQPQQGYAQANPEQYGDQMAAGQRSSQAEQNMDTISQASSLRNPQPSQHAGMQAAQHQPTLVPTQTFVGQSLMPGSISLSQAIQGAAGQGQHPATTSAFRAAAMNGPAE